MGQYPGRHDTLAEDHSGSLQLGHSAQCRILVCQPGVVPRHNPCRCNIPDVGGRRRTVDRRRREGQHPCGHSAQSARHSHRTAIRYRIPTHHIGQFHTTRKRRHSPLDHLLPHFLATVAGAGTAAVHTVAAVRVVLGALHRRIIARRHSPPLRRIEDTALRRDVSRPRGHHIAPHRHSRTPESGYTAKISIRRHHHKLPQTCAT